MRYLPLLAGTNKTSNISKPLLQQRSRASSSSSRSNPSSSFFSSRTTSAHLTTHHLYQPQIATHKHIHTLKKQTKQTPQQKTMAFETKATIANFGGQLLKLTHQSTSTQTPMNLNLYLPPAALSSSSSSPPNKKVPVLIYLSGLTCTPDNCAEKGFLQAHASRLGLAIVYPDTSPRGAGVATEDDSWDFGTGAGFYVDATAEPWRANYRMESYVARELPDLLFSPPEKGGFGDKLDKDRVSIAGHSMGGHGALTLYLKYPGAYRSVSAWAPICEPGQCAWGRKAFSGYFGEEGEKEKEELWKGSDATELVKKLERGTDLRCLIDVGTGDGFYKDGQLRPESFEKAVKEAGVEGVEVRYQKDYDHSYFFISSFGQDHVEHAAKYLL
ncbi:carbohydrate esterase family 1 protein [Xylariomycetidae sp. FL2044]|nr:carbohydrate esterase family 1 protein [Xylariomycetidae sp. FL2044]